MVDEMTTSNAQFVNDIIVENKDTFLVNERTRFVPKSFFVKNGSLTLKRFQQFDGTKTANLANLPSPIVVQTRHPFTDVLQGCARANADSADKDKDDNLYKCPNGSLFQFVESAEALKKAQDSGKLTVGPSGHLHLRDIALIGDKRFFPLIKQEGISP